MKSMSTCDSPQASSDASSCSIMNGISMAVEVISERTKLQQSALNIYYKNSLGKSFTQCKNFR